MGMIIKGAFDCTFFRSRTDMNAPKFSMKTYRINWSYRMSIKDKYRYAVNTIFFFFISHL